MNKKSRKFIKVLARKLIKGQDYSKKKKLKKAFEKAVNELPESELQASLQSNFTDAFTIFKSQIEKLKVLTEPLVSNTVQTNIDTSDRTSQNLEGDNGEIKTEDKVPKLERTKISDQHFNFPYNFYVKKNILRPTASKDAVDQYYLKLIQNHTGMASVIKCVKEYQRRINDKSVLSTLNHLLIISTGIKDRLFIKKLLYVYLTKMQPLVEKYLEEDNVKKASNLQENLHKFLYVSHLRYFASESSDELEEKPFYNDLLASLLSLYLDLSIYLFRNEERKEKLAKLIYHFISYLLVQTPQYKYDVLLQVTQVNKDRVLLILPLIKFCLSGNIVKTDVESYIKYILTVAMVNNLHLPDTININDDIKKARSITAPNGTIQWLKERVSEEIMDFDELNNDNLSFYLLENLTDSLHSMLIDSLCDKEGLELDDDLDTTNKEGAQPDEPIVFQPDLSGFFDQDKTSQDDEIDINSLFLMDRSGSSKKTNDSTPIIPSTKKSMPLRKIAVITPNSHDEGEPDKLQDSPGKHKEQPKEAFTGLKKTIADDDGVDVSNQKQRQVQEHKSGIQSSHLVSKELKDTKEIAEDVIEKKTSYLVNLSSPEPQTRTRIKSPDSKPQLSSSPLISKKSTRTPVSPIMKTPKKEASLAPSPQITSSDNHHCLRSPGKPKHCPCEDHEKKTPRLLLKKRGDSKSPIVSPKTFSLAAPEIKSPSPSKSQKLSSPKEQKTPTSSKIMSSKISKSPGSLKKEVIDISDEDVAIVAVTPGNKKSKHAIADWRGSADSIVSDSEGTDVESTTRQTWKQNTHIPDLSVHLTSKVKKTSGDELSTLSNKDVPVNPEPDTILVSSSSKEISSDSTLTPEKTCRGRNNGAKSNSDSNIIEMSGTPIKVTPRVGTPAKESRRKSRGIAATPRIETASSSTPSSTRRSRKPKSTGISDKTSDRYSSESDVYMFNTDSEPVPSKSHAKRLSGHQMKGVLDQSNSSELSTGRSPISLRSRDSGTSNTPSASKSKKVVSDSEVVVKSRVRTRRMSESSVEDVLKSQSSTDATPSKMRKKDKTAALLDTINESPTKSLKKPTDTPIKYSLRNR